MEDDLQWKMTFSGRQPLVEDDLLWKNDLPFEDDLLWEDDLRWKTAFGGRRPSVDDDLHWKTTFVGSLHAVYSALQHFLPSLALRLQCKA